MLQFKKISLDLLYIISGCAFAAFGTTCFLLPNKLSSGGFAGIATMLYYFLHVPMGTTIIFLNIPFFVLGYFKLGKKFMVKTIFATVLYSQLINVFENMTIFTHDRFLACIYGGILIGIGLAIVLKAEASTGGTDLIAYLAQAYHMKMRMSNVLVMVDIIIVGLNLIAFRDVEVGLYSAIAIFMVGKMIDFIFEGINFCKMIYIISDQYEKILDAIQYKADRGATGLYGKGAYTKKDKVVILCVTKRRDIIMIKNIATEIDQHAFIIISDAREVYGLGFKD